MANSSRTYNLPKIFHIEAKPFIAFDSPVDDEDLGFEDENDEEEEEEEEEEEPDTRVIVKVEAGPLVSTLTIDLKRVTKKVEETYAECYGAFKPGNLNFEFADQNGNVWLVQCPIRGNDFYDMVFEGASLHFWERAPNELKKEFEEGKFLRLEPWSCGHLEDEYRVAMVTIGGEEHELSTRDAYPTLELSWSDKRTVFIVKQIGWNTEEMEELEPIYFELGVDEIFPLQAHWPGVTFHKAKDKRGTPQPNISVKVEEA